MDSPNTVPEANNRDRVVSFVAEASSVIEPQQQIDEAAEILRNFTKTVCDQDALERDIVAQAELEIAKEEDKRDEQRIARTEASKTKLINKKLQLQQKLDAALQRGQRSQVQQLEVELSSITDKLIGFDGDIASYKDRIERRHLDPKASSSHEGSKEAIESSREYLIRTGKITPFARLPPEIKAAASQNVKTPAIQEQAPELGLVALDEPQSHQNLQKPGFDVKLTATSKLPAGAVERMSLSGSKPQKRRKSDSDVAADDDFVLQSSGSNDDSDVPRRKPKKVRKAQRKNDAVLQSEAEEKGVVTDHDDGNESVFQARLTAWVDQRRAARIEAASQRGETLAVTDVTEPEWFRPHPHFPDWDLQCAGLKLPGDIYKVLFNYQKTGIRWLAELYDQETGGILGDEMGLGKTVQAVSFVAALHYSKKLTKLALVVVPATLMRQWVNEFHQWWPSLRVSILHSSGSGMVNIDDECQFEDEQTKVPAAECRQRRGTKIPRAAKNIIDRVTRLGHVLVTTYAGLQTYAEHLVDVEWSCAILDEGHKIRNPNTAVTITCKKLLTRHRIIISGTPMQNNLSELWSIFDFVCPFRLGTLSNFRDEFEIPIKQGGYANSSNLQIMAAEKCAEVLKEIIGPYLLQRVKADVAQDLPKKTEQVVFCKFTETQRRVYERWLASDQKDLILDGKMKALVGIDTLRKICNHPDLSRPEKHTSYGKSFGDPELSGKMQVSKGLIAMWKRMGHKCLVFCQGTQMLNIFEKMVNAMSDIIYLRMDGSTPVKDRQKLVDQFNLDPTVDVFLLTTRVGGLGLNLIGASRVILFDPDWNPSTDAQAQERAWRLGQKKDVQIFRLLTAGTIEEKIYQRQIYKTVLTNKVLKDPTQRSTFVHNQLAELFKLDLNDNGETETGTLLKTIGNPPHPPRHWANQTESSMSNASLELQEEVQPHTPAEHESNVELVGGVVGLENYNETSAPTTTQEERLMEGIFVRSGVTSTLKHEHIVNGRIVKVNESILQREAQQIADRARTRVQKYQQEARKIPIGSVTWTGEFGNAGCPTAQAVDSSAAGTSRALAPGTKLSKRDFMPLIVQFIKRHKNKAPTKSIVDHFNPFCPNSRQSEVFKSALSTVATLVKDDPNSRDGGYWKLNKSFDGSDS